MSNYYQHYYNGKHYRGQAPGTETFRLKLANYYSQGTQRQKKLHADLLKFCKENNLLKYPMRGPRDFREASCQIKAMYTIIDKHGLMDKWKSKGETADAEQSET